MGWPSPCRMLAFHPKMEKGWKWLLCVHIACLGSCVWMLGLVPLLKFSCQTNVLGGQISTKCLPLPRRREGCQGRWCFTPVRWQRVLFYLPMPCSFQNTERNQGELMHPGKCWASVEAHFYKCQRPLRGFTWEAAALLGLTQSRQLFGTSWENPSGGIRVVDSSPLFLGHLLGAGP